MDEIERLIAAYRCAVFDADGEAWGKTAALESLEEYLPDSRVLEFFLEIVADPTEYDMARVHILKLFEFEAVPGARDRIGACIAAALTEERDWMVRCWLGRAVASYADIPAARSVAIARALDQAEFEDVRHNCLPGLRVGHPDIILALETIGAGEGTLAGVARKQLMSLTQVKADSAADQ